MKSIIFFRVALIACALVHSAAQAQNVPELAQMYPGQEAVVYKNQLQYKITVVNDEPVVESKDLQQIVYLTNQKSGYLSKYSFVHSSFHQVQEYQAYTKTAESKKIKVTDFKTSHSKSSGIFYDNVKEVNFDFPAVGMGAVGTLELSMKHKDAHLLSPFYFTRGVPVMNSELQITFPKDMSVKYIIRNDDKGVVTFSEETKRGEKTYRFLATNLSEERGYEDAPSHAWYSPHVIFYIENYKNAAGETVRYLGNQDDLYKLNYSFINNLNKEQKPVITALVDSLTRNVTSQEQKARNIYRWVQDNVKYVAFEEGMDGFVPRDAGLVCTRRFGDCKDMASILTVMLNTAGIPAYYTWIGTRSLPYKYSEVPTPIVDNHMICTILLNGQYIFLDGTDSHCVFGMPSGHIQGKEALLSINEKEYKVLTVPVPSKESTTFVDSTILSYDGGELKGKVNLRMTGYHAMNLHANLGYVTENSREKMIKSLLGRGSNKFTLQKFETPATGDFNLGLVTGEFTLPDYVKKAGDDIFINVNLFKHFLHKEIDFPKRKMPIEFEHLAVQKWVTILQIPAGYKVTYMPKSKSFKNEVGGYELTYEQKGDQIIFTQTFENKYMMLMPDQFEKWNKVLENLFPLYKESVNLTKI